ncbi:hypothetical protein [Phenylobacterium sp.]|uniref:hypothetical protein n=1 Tax=Phenylobacterium sp. TaxID=1871053 RepID=UPI0027311BB4|nr:hypothetical protein [Phenylobacterium sp.]MDP1598512.1 hypothetical protein [Phenylobacterium sp.]MDP3592701.1 hypothetical protein [Phenylobacterium sp.]
MTPMTASSPSPRNDERAESPSRPRQRKFSEIVEGVRRQREHLRMLDGADPLRGGVAD